METVRVYFYTSHGLQKNWRIKKLRYTLELCKQRHLLRDPRFATNKIIQSMAESSGFVKTIRHSHEIYLQPSKEKVILHQCYLSFQQKYISLPNTLKDCNHNHSVPIDIPLDIFKTWTSTTAPKENLMYRERNKVILDYLRDRYAYKNRKRYPYERENKGLKF